jgi:hypothetical protein
MLQIHDYFKISFKVFIKIIIKDERKTMGLIPWSLYQNGADEGSLFHLLLLSPTITPIDQIMH